MKSYYIILIVILLTSCTKQIDYSTDIKKLKSEIEFLKQNNIKYENDLSTLKIQVSSFKLQMDSIQKQTDSIKSELKLVNKSVQDLYTTMESINKLILDINKKITQLQMDMEQVTFQYSRILSSIFDIADNLMKLNMEVSVLIQSLQNLQNQQR